jgi:hypothetical protein
MALVRLIQVCWRDRGSIHSQEQRNPATIRQDQRITALLLEAQVIELQATGEANFIQAILEVTDDIIATLLKDESIAARSTDQGVSTSIPLQVILSATTAQ